MIKCVAFDCFGTLFDMSGVPKEEIAAYVNHVRKNDFTPYQFPESWYSLKAHPDVEFGFAMLWLNDIYPIALSNGSIDLINMLAINNGLRFFHIVDLVKHKVYKPHVDAYRTIEKDLGIKPQDTLMVTANPTFGDIEGAAAVGMPSQVIRHGHPNTVVELFDLINTFKDGQ